MTTRRYIVNGVEYDRLEDIPAEFRHFFSDADGDGVPDAAASAPEDGTVRRRVWRGRLEDAPPEVREMIEETGGGSGFSERVNIGGSRVVSRRSRPANRRDVGGVRVISALELRGWESFPGEGNALELRPGTAAIGRCWGTAGAAALISILILIGDGWHTDPLRIGLHSSLWGMALLWLASPFWMRLRLIRDDVHNTVWIRGRRMLFPIRLDFPLHETSVTVKPTFHRKHRHSVDDTGWRWHMLIVAEGRRPLTADVGFTLGRDAPARPPADVSVMCKQLANTFGSPVEVHAPGGGAQRILPEDPSGLAS